MITNGVRKIKAEAIGVGGARYGRHCLSVITTDGESFCIEISIDTLLGLQQRLEELNPVAIARVAVDRPLINETEVEGPVIEVVHHRHEEGGVLVDENGMHGEDEKYFEGKDGDIKNPFGFEAVTASAGLGKYLEDEYQKSRQRSTTSDPEEIHMYEESQRGRRGWNYTDYDPEEDPMGKVVGL